MVAGKPEPPLHAESVERVGAVRPLVVGDRLDTDIEGAVRGGADSLLVLTGVTAPADVLLAPVQRRPAYMAADLSGLNTAHPEVTVQDGAFQLRRLDGLGRVCRSRRLGQFRRVGEFRRVARVRPVRLAHRSGSGD